MIWLTSSILMLMTYPKTNTMLMENIVMEEDLKNIMTMTMMMGIMFSFTKMKELSWKEKKEKSIMILIILMAMTTFITTSTLWFVTMMEMTMIPLVYLVMNYAKGKEKTQSMKYFIFMNSLGSIPFMLFSIKKLSLSSDWELEELSYSMNQSGLMAMAFLTLLVVKTPLIMFHLWLSNAHVSAPGTCSMILAGILIKMGTMGLMKFSSMYLTMTESTESWWMALGSMSLMFMTGAMVRYFDIKTMIALSSILHMSFMMILMSMNKMTSNISMIMMMTGHGLVSYYLFYMITMKYEMTENRSSMFNKSKESTMKMTTLFMIAFMFMNMGMPPLINFMSEMLTCISILTKSKMMLSITMIYMTIFVTIVMMYSSSSSYGKKQNLEKGEMNQSLITKSTFLMLSTCFIMSIF